MTKHTQNRCFVNTCKQGCTKELKATKNEWSHWLARANAYKKVDTATKSYAQAILSGKRSKPVTYKPKPSVKPFAQTTVKRANICVIDEKKTCRVYKRSTTAPLVYMAPSTPITLTNRFQPLNHDLDQIEEGGGSDNAHDQSSVGSDVENTSSNVRCTMSNAKRASANKNQITCKDKNMDKKYSHEKNNVANDAQKSNSEKNMAVNAAQQRQTNKGDIIHPKGGGGGGGPPP